MEDVRAQKCVFLQPLPVGEPCDSWSPGRQGQQCPQESRAERFMFMWFSVPEQQRHNREETSFDGTDYTACVIVLRLLSLSEGTKTEIYIAFDLTMTRHVCAPHTSSFLAGKRNTIKRCFGGFPSQGCKFSGRKRLILLHAKGSGEPHT